MATFIEKLNWLSKNGYTIKYELDQDIEDWKIMLDVVHGNIQHSNLKIARRTLDNLIEQLTALREMIE
jgi:hypothetical protein